MKITPQSFAKSLRMQTFADFLIKRAKRHDPDVIIGEKQNPYLLRWYLQGGYFDEEQNKWRSNSILGARAYLHCFLRSDDDRALHDHPSASLSLALRGTAIEHTIAAGGINHRRLIKPGDFRYRSAKFAHRMEIEPGSEFWTLFIFGPDFREWGFHCKDRWVHWRDYTASSDAGLIGRGCD